MLEFGGFRSWLFRPPGYGDFLEQFDPEIHTRQAAAGVPTRFEDAVGWMTKLSGQPGSDGSPRFAITFTVADTDAVARFCEELGGTVLQAPITMGPVARRCWPTLKWRISGSAITIQTGNRGSAVDDDVEAMSREELTREIKRLRDGIRKHRDSTGHDLCWHHPALWGLLPEATDPLPTVPDWPQFLRGCIRYRQSLDEQVPGAPRTTESF